MTDTDRDDYWLPESLPEGFEECPHGMLIRYAMSAGSAPDGARHD